MGLPWYRVHTVVLNDPGRLLSVHIMHTALVAGWAGSMALYELAVFDPSDPVLDPMWRQDDCGLDDESDVDPPREPVPFIPKDFERGSDKEEENLPHKRHDHTSSSLNSGELEVGKDFSNKDSFLSALKQHSIMNLVNYNVVKSKSDKFEVKCAVRFDALHYPCARVITTCQNLRLDPMSYVNEVYKIQYMYNVWRHVFPPVPDERKWPSVSLAPFKMLSDRELRRKPEGRPYSTRIRNNMDIRETTNQQKLCGWCRNPVHTTRLCPNRNS
ncbi:hypothetical protein GOBAR_AA05408 [Gossypium barbadense]|uniref:Uncharacterized protein n=1 Tax=Gossypium barbadense TaxID=3634 RepID=A0A2P5YHV4_GOSBA|nr:hypothetical protein GOBAR_AA05408 [Gossypium barbadense]